MVSSSVIFFNLLENIHSFQKSALEQGIREKAAFSDFHNFCREKYL
jgi:hypothetical protein